MNRRLLHIPATIAATAFLTVAVPLAAQAHDKTAGVDCTAATVSLTNYDRGATALLVLDGVTLHEGTFGGRLVGSYPVAGNSEHTFTVTVRSNDGSRYNFDYSQTTTGCYVPPVVPEYPGDRITTTETDTTVDCETGRASKDIITWSSVGTWNPELNDWVWSEPVEVRRETVSRVIYENECPVVIPDPTCADDEELSNGVCVPADLPNPDPPVTPDNPSTPASPDRLATTGYDLSDATPWAALAAVMGAAGYLLLRRKGKHA